MAKTPQATSKKLSFERAIEELEMIVKRLEDARSRWRIGRVYERGEALKRRCEEIVAAGRARVEKITTAPAASHRRRAAGCANSTAILSSSP